MEARTKIEQQTVGTCRPSSEVVNHQAFANVRAPPLCCLIQSQAMAVGVAKAVRQETKNVGRNERETPPSDSDGLDNDFRIEPPEQ